MTVELRSDRKRMTQRVLAVDLSARVLAQLCLIATARIMAPESFGIFILASTALSLVLLLADAGLGEAGVARFTATDRSAEAQRLGQLRGRVGNLIGLLALATSALLWSFGVVEVSAVVILLSVPAWLLATNWQFQLRIEERLPQSAAAGAVLIVTMAVAPLVGVLTLNPTPISAVLALTVGIWFVGLATSVRGGSEHFRGSLSGARGALAAGAPFLFVALSVGLYSRGERLILGAFVGSAETGRYAAAYGLVLGAAMVGSALQTALFPNLVRRARSGQLPLRAIHRLAIAAAAKSLPIALLVALLAPEIMRIFYGSPFRSGGHLLLLLSPLIVLYVINPILSTSLVAHSGQGEVAKVAGTNLLIALISFPVAVLTLGAAGVAMASVLIELVGTIGLLVALRHRSDASWGRPVGSAPTMP